MATKARIARYTKEDVDLHSDGRKAHPAVNVKVHNFPNADQVVDRFHCSERTAERVIRVAFECQQEHFWEDAQSDAELVFSSGVKIYSEGRSGGWLVVFGLGDIDNWDAIALSKWRRFERYIQQSVKWLSDWDQVSELIEMNDWAHDQAAMENVIAESLA